MTRQPLRRIVAAVALAALACALVPARALADADAGEAMAEGAITAPVADADLAAGESRDAAAGETVATQGSDAPAEASDEGISAGADGGEGETLPVIPQESEEGETRQPPTLGVAVHLGGRGWQRPVGAGALAGTTGQSRAVEAIRLSLGGDWSAADGTVECKVHVSGLGWRGWVAAGKVAGTTGQSRAIEAVRIRLTEGLASAYDVYYQVHVANVGWMALAKNGASAGTVGQALRVEALRVWLVPSGSAAPRTASAVRYASRHAEGLLTRAHVQNVGWLGAVDEGATAGTTGRGLRLEAFSVSASNLEAAGSVEYRAHVQDVGWQSVRRDGQAAGTTGRGRRVEAVQLRLTGGLRQAYVLWYRVHVSLIGWLDWTSDWGVAGSVGLSLPIEAVQLRLVARPVAGQEDPAGPTSSDTALASPSVTASSVRYAAYVQGDGWQSAVADGRVGGTTGRGRRLEALRVQVVGDAPSNLPGKVSYRVHLQNSGWQAWRSQDAEAGLAGRGMRVEAVQAKLAGRLAGVFDLWYRAHVEGIGWLGWTRNGASAGTTGVSRRVEAVQMRLVAKTGSAPGPTARSYLNATSLYDEMGRRAQGYDSSTGQLVLVNLGSHRVGVFTGSRGNWTRVKNFVCSVGAPATPTVRGTFRVGSRGYAFGSGYTCYYWTQFFGDYLFHSIKYYQGSFNVMDGRLGANVSHGCVRMAIEDARWINQNVRSGTTVVVY